MADSVPFHSKDSDRITRDYFDSLLIETRYLDSVVPDTSISLFGHRFATPVMTAALSHLNNTAPDGMRVYAEGARLSNAVHWVGMGSEKELEEITATGARCVKIIKPYADNDKIFRRIEHAVRVGCIAVGMDIDHSFSSDGRYDNVFGLAMKAKTTSELRKFVQACPVPFVVKGVMSNNDAVKCLEAGAAAIQVSHHHGMVEYSVPPLKVLPDIIRAVGSSVPVFVDCGFASGMDVYKALALGAKAVSVGRHLMPLLKQGSAAVSDRINRITDELRGVMARTCVRDLSCMDPSVIHRRDF